MVPSLPWEVVKIKIYTVHETVNPGSSRYSENGNYPHFSSSAESLTT